MSGGFFRGTSAEQDTRFSNKQAKLLKTQKFAPVLDHPVDVTKVKMDVIRPWIATRATELLGFEDEVLINFVYGLLDGKVDGKQIQIQLTGFLEKNTGKFMKELWGLLLSAQNNASGVPQQFLDAKEEELKKRMAESERITQEIQKRKEKEGREFEQEKQKRMDAEAGITAVSGSSLKHSLPKDSRVQSEERDMESTQSPRLKRREGRSRSRSLSSHSQGHSLSPSRRYHSPHRRAMSSERQYKSPARRSISPRSNWSPSRRRSPRRRSPSPIRRKSPYGRRSPLLRCRSPPSRHRSPVQNRRRSPSPSRHRRSPSPSRHRRSPSPSRQRRPPAARRVSPIRRRSLSPARDKAVSPWRSPRNKETPRNRFQQQKRSLHSPGNYGGDSQVSLRARKRSSSPHRSISPSYPAHRGSSRETDTRSNGYDSIRRRDKYSPKRAREKRSPVHHTLHREVVDHSDFKGNILDPLPHILTVSSRSSSPDSRDQNDIHSKDYDVPLENSSEQSDSPSHLRKSPTRRNRLSEKRLPNNIQEINDNNEESYVVREDAYCRTDSSSKKGRDSAADMKKKRFHAKKFSQEEFSNNGLEVDHSPSNQDRHSNMGIKNKETERKSYTEYGPERVQGEKHSMEVSYDRQHSTKITVQVASASVVSNELVLKSSRADLSVSDAEKRAKSRSDAFRESHYETESVKKSERKMDTSSQAHSNHSDSEETNTHKYRSTKKRHKKSDRHRREDETSEPDSHTEDKEAKRRRKDEKRLRKEERRRKREDKHRKRSERHAEKLKVKSIDTVTPPPDFEKYDNSKSDGEASIKTTSRLADAEGTESEEKRLEIELREKALESLRAKKGIGH
ncbi:unnamed protein product [Musa banksii]